MPAYNLNCWLQLFNREPGASVETMRHTTLATARLRFLFVAARIWRHAGRVGVSYSDHYQEKGTFQRLMERLRKSNRSPGGFALVIAAPHRRLLVDGAQRERGLLGNVGSWGDSLPEEAVISGPRAWFKCDAEASQIAH